MSASLRSAVPTLPTSSPRRPLFPILWQLTRRDLEQSYRGSVLGLTWHLLSPLLMMLLFVVVFGYVFNQRFNVVPHETRLDYGLGIYLGLILYGFWRDILQQAPLYILRSRDLVKHVVFPLQALPLSAVAGASLRLLLNLLLWFTIALFAGRPLGPGALWLPVILAPLVLLALGSAWFLSSVGVYLRDISQVLPVFTQVLFWTSGIFYPAQRLYGPDVPDWIWEVFRFNPLLQIIDASRHVLLWQLPFSVDAVLYCWGLGLAVGALGLAAFARLRPGFADLL